MSLTKNLIDGLVEMTYCTRKLIYSHIQNPAFNNDKSLLYFSQASIDKKTKTIGDLSYSALEKIMNIGVNLF